MLNNMHPEIICFVIELSKGRLDVKSYMWFKHLSYKKNYKLSLFMNGIKENYTNVNNSYTHTGMSAAFYC